MKHYYKAPWQWFCEPSGKCYWRAPGGNAVGGAVDLRSNTQAGKSGGTPEGFGVFAYAEPQTIPGAEYLGTNPTPVAEMVWTKLTTEADPTGKTAPKPLTGRVGKEVALYIGGDKVKSEGFKTGHRQRTIEVFQEDYRVNVTEYPKALLQKWVGAKMLEIFGEMSDAKANLLVPVEHRKGVLWKKPETTISDPFTNTDGTALESHSAAGFSWSKLAGNSMMVQSNKVQRNATTGHGDRDYRADSDLSTDDMYSKATVGSLGTDFDCAVCARYSASARTHYQTEWGNGFRRISKFVAGAHSVLQSDGSGNSVGDVLEVRVDGTTIKAYRNSAQVLTDQTDTDITGHLRAGLSIWHDQSTWDTWEAADLAGAPASVVQDPIGMGVVPFPR